MNYIYIFISSSEPKLFRKKSVKQKMKNNGLTGFMLDPDSREKEELLPPGELGRSDVRWGEVKVYDYCIFCQFFLTKLLITHTINIK